jgi:hypothetical protein
LSDVCRRRTEFMSLILSARKAHILHSWDNGAFSARKGDGFKRALRRIEERETHLENHPWQTEIGGEKSFVLMQLNRTQENAIQQLRHGNQRMHERNSSHIRTCFLAL